MKKIIILLLICNFAQAQLPAVVDGGTKIVTRGLTCWYNPCYKRSYIGSGDTLNSLINTNRMALANGVSFSSSNGGIFLFDGVNDVIYPTADRYSAAPNNRITLEAWVWQNNFTGIQSYFFTVNAIAGVQQTIFRSQSNAIYFYAYIGGSLRSIITANGVTTVNTWNHLVATWDGTNLRIYVNGTQQSISSAITGTMTNSSDCFNVISNSPETINGKIGVVRIYNQALTLTEVQQNYNAELKRFQ